MEADSGTSSSIIEETVETVRIDNHVDEQKYIDAIRRAIDRHFARPRSLLIEPELVMYSMQSHDYHTMESVDRVRLNRLRAEVERVQHAISSGLFLQDRNADGAIDGPICSICYNNLHERSPTALTTCGHIYCSSCISKQLGDWKTPTPPKCLKCNTSFNPQYDRLRVLLHYN